MRVLAVDDSALANKPRLSATTEEPSHTRIEQWLMGRIDGGRLLPDDKLPPEEELAAALGVSRMTLR
ncbi:MAG: GntR family transcriptional regulator, partial [Aeromicrobium sp.]